MKRNLKEKTMRENKLITKCIFHGLTTAQIARLLNYSQSTVSKRLAGLFDKYSAKTRCEFILGVLGEVIDKNNLTLDAKRLEVDILNEKIDALKSLFGKMKKNKDNLKELRNGLLEVESVFKSYT